MNRAMDSERIDYAPQSKNKVISILKAGGAELSKAKLLRFGAGLFFFLLALFFKFSPQVEILLFLVSYLLFGGEVIFNALKNIAEGEFFEESFLMTVATLGALAIGEYLEAVAVMLFFDIGLFLEDLAVDHSRRSIASLMDIRPDFANLIRGKDIVEIAPQEVKIGQTVLIKPGEKVPLDGRVIEGSSFIDTSALTGESIPRKVGVDSTILSGSINISGLLKMEVTKEFGDSTVSKILDLVQKAQTKKAPTEKFITKFAKYYTPTVIFAAAAIAVFPPLILSDALFRDWFYRAIVFLVVACPCALVISIPLAFFGGIGGASKRGILIKGSNYLEALNEVKTVVFDKTGTLTKGVFRVTKVVPQNGFCKEEILQYTALAESYSHHPLALSVLKAYGKEIEKEEIESYEEIAGKGVKIKAKGKTILAGNEKLLEEENIVFSRADALGTIIYVAVDGTYGGYIVVADELKEGAFSAIQALRQKGIKKIAMLSGDSKKIAEGIARKLGLDEVYAELLPQQKMERLEKLEEEKSAQEKVMFVGDGLNDAPVLMRADIGVAMGALGADAAVEAADIVLMTDEPLKLVEAMDIAHKTRSVVWQNIIFALCVKALVLIFAVLGVATMWEAVFADVGVTIIAVLNTLRLLEQ